MIFFGGGGAGIAIPVSMQLPECLSSPFNWRLSATFPGVDKSKRGQSFSSSGDIQLARGATVWGHDGVLSRKDGNSESFQTKVPE